MPFRKQQPNYQRRWRLSRRLREIREQMGEPKNAVLNGLRGLATRAEMLIPRAKDGAQTGVLAGVLLDRALAAVRLMIAAMEQVMTSTAELRALGL